jgi:hypothetical protein
MAQAKLPGDQNEWKALMTGYLFRNDVSGPRAKKRKLPVRTSSIATGMWEARTPHDVARGKADEASIQELA